MGVLDSILHGRQARPRRTVIYSIHGWGKSTWASNWPSPLFLPTEDGNADIDCDSLPLFTDHQSIYDAIMELGHDQLESPYQTYVIDSADWLDSLCNKAVCQEKSIAAVGEIGYGKGYELAEAKFKQILSACDGLRAQNKHVIFTAHCEIKRFDAPEGESYDRYLPKLGKKTSALLQEWADEVLFGQYRVYSRKTDKDLGPERIVATGTGERIIKTCERPGWQAKNRLNLPEEMSVDFNEYAQYLPPIS